MPGVALMCYVVGLNVCGSFLPIRYRGSKRVLFTNQIQWEFWLRAPYLRWHGSAESFGPQSALDNHSRMGFLI